MFIKKLFIILSLLTFYPQESHADCLTKICSGIAIICFACFESITFYDLGYEAAHKSASEARNEYRLTRQFHDAVNLHRERVGLSVLPYRRSGDQIETLHQTVKELFECEDSITRSDLS